MVFNGIHMNLLPFFVVELYSLIVAVGCSFLRVCEHSLNHAAVHPLTA